MPEPGGCDGSRLQGCEGQPAARLQAFIARFDPREQKFIGSVRAAEALIAASIDLAGVPLPATGRGQLIIRTDSEKNPSRRRPGK